LTTILTADQLDSLTFNPGQMQLLIDSHRRLLLELEWAVRYCEIKHDLILAYENVIFGGLIREEEEVPAPSREVARSRINAKPGFFESMDTETRQAITDFDGPEMLPGWDTDGKEA
jgi:hypothetical protein